MLTHLALERLARRAGLTNPDVIMPGIVFAIGASAVTLPSATAVDNMHIGARSRSAGRSAAHSAR